MSGYLKCQGHLRIQQQALRDDVHDPVCAGEACASRVLGRLMKKTALKPIFMVEERFYLWYNYDELYI